jgi:hypothetical protein
MSDNKYKEKTEKEKDKCEKLITEIYGDNYYFMHGTTEEAIENILKSGKIKIGTHTDERNYTHERFGHLPYAYCNIEFDDVPINFSFPLFSHILLLHPRILFENDEVIFNKEWHRYPIEDSIYIKKEDTYNNKKQKIKEIKEYLIELKKGTDFYENYHEILFTKDIKLKDNLLNVNLKDNIIGIISINRFNYPKKSIEELLKKYEYNNVKIYTDIKTLPPLCELLIE